MLMFSACSDRNNPEYTAPEEQHLAVGCVALQGDGSADSPLLHEVTIRNDGEISWNGIIRLDLSFDSLSPRFFMPGFMYGTNRGDAPLQTGSKAPRLRKGSPDFPASAWWMTRSDRLSHPAVFAFAGNRITGLCASPYFLRADGRITPSTARYMSSSGRWSTPRLGQMAGWMHEGRRQASQARGLRPLMAYMLALGPPRSLM